MRPGRDFDGFQFPLSERTNCNKSAAVRAAVAIALSVSSIGTNELQLLDHEDEFVTLRTFSFLYRNERTATCVLRPSDHIFTCFQFPLSERTNCNC